MTTGAAILIAYLVGLCFLGWHASRGIHDADDFVLAGRSLGLRLSLGTLLATWIGAGTLVVASDETARIGMRAIALEPLGAGLALVVGAMFAARIWRLRVSTLPDVFHKLYGKRAEWVAAMVLVPADVGFVAVQYLALGAIIQLYLQIPMWLALPIVAGVGLFKTWHGGLRAVAWTDSLQVGLVVLGAGLVAVMSVVELGGGSLGEGWWVLSGLGGDRLDPVPPVGEVLPWVSILVAASLGNLADQALVQRICAARSAKVAAWACGGAGLAYLVLGLAPVVVGLAAPIVAPEVVSAVMPALGEAVLHPLVHAVFLVTLVAAVMSTIDSAMLAPAAVLAHNVGARSLGWNETVSLHRTCLVLVGVTTLSVALADLAPYRLLTLSFEVCLVTLVVPMVLGLTRNVAAREEVALLSIAVGVGVWLPLVIVGSDTLPFTPIPTPIGATGLAAFAYIGADALLGAVDFRSKVRHSQTPAPTGSRVTGNKMPADSPVAP